MIYLASPYTHEDREVEHQRYHAACRAVHSLVKEGNVVFSPIVYCHPIREAVGIPGDVGYWWDFNLPFLSAASHFTILMLDGWSLSGGVNREIGFFAAQGLSPEFMEEVLP